MNAIRSCPIHRLLQNRHITNRCLHILKKKRGIYLNDVLHGRVFSTSFALANKQKIADFDLSEFPPERIRNFSIIAHVDHGKSTLADRLLETTGVISVSSKNQQVLDRLQVEKERGITVKAQTASLFYTHQGTRYLLNLIDTPGHVDFNYEVSRSLSACQGVILLVDANQGVQAQTVANFFLAFDRDLPVIPVLNKIDLKGAQPDVVMQQLNKLFDIQPEEVLQVSAKLGTGINEVLQAIVERIPAPVADVQNPLKCLMFDSWYTQYRGAVASIAVLDGVVRKGDKIMTHHKKKVHEVQEIGIMYPTEYPTDVLYAGQVGYIIANMKNIKDAMVGETIYHQNQPTQPMPGFKPAKPMVFAGIFPADSSQHTALKTAIEKLTLNDSSVDIHVDSSAVLGQGWRLGFLGLLHMDVFITRLDQEFNASVIVTAPNVPYKVTIIGAKNIKQYGGETVTILNPCKLPPVGIITEYKEPMVKGTVIAPAEYIGDIVNIIMERRGTYPEQTYLDESRMMFTSVLPLNEILVDFFDELKSLSSGYASFDYEDADFQTSDLVKVNYMLNGKEVDELTMLLHKSRARDIAKKVCEKLQTNIPRQSFLITIQAAVGKTILAREDIKPFRKDVTAKCYGGDVSRKTKLLKQQAEGKKKMRLIGRIEVPRDAFINILKK
ncbi:translation factor Guf1, mitochondrial-like isoform X2 [Mercenaria mercenaria]|uniref:translation factor Guf1, mitochondrial-like isoform X2 n=1 Tax=Mercenaria mercenaria TaxID=6596 RepID=UPI001E1E2053|nr:translation factor Guf1, mitochondrial-like isoform X2 [Mercenaria mercenaria]